MRSGTEHLTFTTFQLSQDLVVPLPTHHDLTVNVFYIHILATMPSIRPHQTSLISDASLDVIDSSG